MLVFVSKWTLLDARGGNRGLEKLKKSCQSGLIEGRLAKLVAVVSVHMRRLKETPRRGEEEWCRYLGPQLSPSGRFRVEEYRI